MYQILGFLHDVLHMSMAFSENERRDLRQQFYDKILNLAHENHINVFLTHPKIFVVEKK